MKVNGNAGPPGAAPLSALSGGDSRKATSKAVPSSGAAVASDRVAVSLTARALHEARTTEQPTDAKKIRALREAIRAGTFRIDPDKIAEKMLQEES